MSAAFSIAVREAAREHAYDRYLSALLAPGGAQDDLIVLAAYLGELARVPLLAREAAIGEIRLQWWRDALAAEAPASGNPVADAMAELMRRRALPRDLVLAPIEGRSREIYEDGIADAAALQAYAQEVEGAPLRVALAVLGTGARDDALVDDAARALALTRLALALPYHLALGRLPLPSEMVRASGNPRGMGEAEAGASVSRLDGRLVTDALAALARFEAAQAGRGLSPAFLPLALVRPYARAVVSPKRDALREPADISPLSRAVRLWFARFRGVV